MIAAGLLAAGTFAAVPATARPLAGCTGAWVCEDFETQTGVPSGQWQVGFPDCSGTGSAVVDQTIAHEGSRSVRINGGGGYCDHVFVGRPLTGVLTGTQLYGRFWIRHGSALPPAHVTFLAMRDANDGNRNIRVGGQNQALQWNRESDDATLPEQSPTGVSLSRPLPVDTWTCVELHLDLGAGQIETTVDGQPVTGLVVDGVPTHDIDSQWLRRANWRPAPTDFRFGWESYGGELDTLWFDDVVLAPTPIGCA